MLNKIMVMAFIMALTVFMYANVLEAQVIEDGLVLYWSFEESTVKGDTVEDIVGENDGTLMGGPKTVEGKYGDGLEFDGSDDFVEMSEMPLGDLTIEAWFKASRKPGTWSRIFDGGRSAGGDIFITANDGRTGGDIAFEVYTLGSAGHEFGSGEIVEVGEWYHVAATYDKDGEGMKLYVNGELKGSDPYNAESYEDWPSPQNWYVGKANWADPLFPGIIDEFRIYERALSLEEVQQNMGTTGLVVVDPVSNPKLVRTWGVIKISK